MRRRNLLFAPVALGILGVLIYFYGGHQTPSGQRPLTDLNSASLSEFKEEFNGNHSHLRMFVLLSPT